MFDKAKNYIDSLRYSCAINNCYSEMERCGIASMGCCRGLTIDDTINYPQSKCIDCPHFVDCSGNEEDN